MTTASVLKKRTKSLEKSTIGVMISEKSRMRPSARVGEYNSTAIQRRLAQAEKQDEFGLVG